MKSEKLHILIAGGGIGGMAAALALLRRGFDVDIFEQAPELREVGAGVQISPNGNRALHSLGVLDTLKDLSSNAQSKVVRLWNTGTTWQAFDFGMEAVKRFGFPYLTVYRPDLLQVLADGVRKEKLDAIHLGHRCVGFSQDGNQVELRFDGATPVSGDVLIGADGVHSRVRAELFGDHPATFFGMVAWRGTIPMERLPERMNRSVATAWLGPKGHIVHYPLRGGKLMNFVATVERDDWQTESWSTEGTSEECAQDFKGWHDDVQIMIGAAPTLFKWALMGRPPLEKWTDRNVTLLGDACHPTLPLLAQGAVMAIEDAVVLGRCVEKFSDDPQEAFRRYENARSGVTRRKVEGALENLQRFHNPAFENEADAAPFVEREWGREAVVKRYDWIYADDVTTVAI